MFKILFSVSMMTLLSCSSTNNMQSTNNNEDSSEWITLFDGKTTQGWHAYGKSSIGKAWEVKDKTLHLNSAVKKALGNGEGGDIVTDQEFENFHLKLEWRIASKGNSGILFYVKEDAKQDIWHTGPEMQVLDNGTESVPGHPDAKIHTHRAGDLYDLLASKEVVKPVGEWNLAEIISNKGKLEFYLNGQQTLSTTMWDENWKEMVAKSKFKSLPEFGKYTKGKIGLQDHGDDVWFRNIRIKKL